MICCSRNETKELDLESKYISQRETLKEEDKISIGKNLKEVLGNLANIKTYNDLLRYVPRITYKSNIRSRVIGNDLIEINEDLWNNEVEPTINISIRYLVEKDTIRFAVIDRIDIDSLYFPDELIFIEEDEFIDNYIHDHNSKFDSQQDIKNFKKAFGYNNSFWQFDYKGLAIESSKMERMFFEMKNGSSESIRKHLKSINPIDQAIGVIGLHIKHNLDEKIDPQNLSYMNLIMDSHQEFYVRMECTSELVDVEQYLSMINWDLVININFEQRDGD